MGVRFSGFVSSRTGTFTTFSSEAGAELRKSRDIGTKLVFLSHKTDDPTAKELAKTIGVLGADVYLAEWDDNITDPGNESLPSTIMEHIHRSDGFLVNANETIRVSMWVGYEIGGAHALQKPRAKFMLHWVKLPSVVAVLETLDSGSELFEWIQRL